MSNHPKDIARKNDGTAPRTDVESDGDLGDINRNLDSDGKVVRPSGWGELMQARRAIIARKNGAAGPGA